MKRLHEFITRLKPYRRRYGIFCIGLFMMATFLFLQIMLILTYAVPHLNGGYYYFFGGFHLIFQFFSSETYACRGFLISGVLVAYIPFICVIPIIYFMLADWFIFEKLSNRFQNISALKYKKWAVIIHFSDIAVVSLLITGIFIFAVGHNPFKFLSSISTINLAFDDGARHFAGIAACIHFGVGYVFGLIVLCWLIGLGIAWIFGKISASFRNLAKVLAERKEQRLAQKLSNKGKKNDKESNS